MKIGDLAKATATPIESIRFYERAGLLPAVGRTDGNYRVYDDGHVQRLAFVRHCRSLDMTLDEIRVLLKFKDAPQDDCGAVNDLLVGDSLTNDLPVETDLPKVLTALRLFSPDHRLEGDDKNWPIQKILEGNLEGVLVKLKEARRQGGRKASSASAAG